MVGVIVVLVVATLAAGYPLGWYKGKSTTPVGACPDDQTIAGAGASLVQSIVTSWSYVYGKETGNTISYTANGAGAGATDFIDRTVDFAATDSPLNASDVSMLPYPALTLPIVGGSVAIIYNLPGVSGTLQLNANLLAGIYNGSIGTWNNSALVAANPGLSLPNAQIQTVHRLDVAGTTLALTQYISNVNSAWKNGPGVGESISWPSTPFPSKAISGNSKLAGYVNTTADSIGYVDLSDAHLVTHVGIAGIENPAGKYVVPTAANTASAIDDISKNTTFPASSGNWQAITMVDSSAPADYPMTALSYGFVYAGMDHGYQPSLAKSQAIRQWFNWIFEDGQANASALYYAPLPSTLITIDEAGLSTLTYDGSALPACH